MERFKGQNKNSAKGADRVVCGGKCSHWMKKEKGDGAGARGGKSANLKVPT